MRGPVVLRHPNKIAAHQPRDPHVPAFVNQQHFSFLETIHNEGEVWLHGELGVGFGPFLFPVIVTSAGVLGQPQQRVFSMRLGLIRTRPSPDWMRRGENSRHATAGGRSSVPAYTYIGGLGPSCTTRSPTFKKLRISYFARAGGLRSVLAAPRCSSLRKRLRPTVPAAAMA